MSGKISMPGERFSLANKKHLTVFVGLLRFMGALCPKCGWGTRRTSKRWARWANGWVWKRAPFEEYDRSRHHGRGKWAEAEQADRWL